MKEGGLGRDGTGRRLLWHATIVVGGLALGAGVTFAVAGGQRSDGHRGHHGPSITRFSFTDGAPGPVTAPLPAPAGLAPPDEPPSAESALARFLEAMVARRPEASYPLLDEASRRRFPSSQAWLRFHADAAPLTGFEIGAARPAFGRDDVTEIAVSSTSMPSLDPTRGLVPGRAQSLWQVRRERQGWRVAAEPVTVRPLLPTEAKAAEAVETWVARLQACDREGASSLQAGTYLYGPAAFVRAPCEERGTWSVGAPAALEMMGDRRDLIAAYGPGVAGWARLVPVEGPASRFWAVVAPMGDEWKVAGVAMRS